jgi:hypothetical protein
MTWNAILIRRLMLLIVCLTATSGCTVCQNLRRTMCREPRAYSWKRDRAQSLKLYREWAGEAWARECAALGEMATPEYRAGFLDGFVDYVYAGGNGEPPPLPPREFWNADMRSPQGRRLADDWFAGYRHGAQTARVGGYRESVTVSTSLFQTGYAEPQVAPHYPSADDELPLPNFDLPPPASSEFRLEPAPEPASIDQASHASVTRPVARQNLIATIPEQVPSPEQAPSSVLAAEARRPATRVVRTAPLTTTPRTDAATSIATPEPDGPSPDSQTSTTTMRIMPGPRPSAEPATGAVSRSPKISIAHEFVR